MKQLIAQKQPFADVFQNRGSELRLMETFWLVKTFVLECLTFN